jgi:hypothetical protein
MTRFREWLSDQEAQPYPHEVEIIQTLQHLTPAQQVKLDIQLHNPDPGRFAGHEEEFLDKDAVLKRTLLDVLEGKIRDENTNQIMQAFVQIDRQNHMKYLSQPPNPNTGSHVWHRAWIQAYDNWLEELRGMNA